MRVIRGIFMTAIVIVALAFVFLFAGVRLLGFQPFVVLSGSMEPTCPVGSVVYAQKIDPLDLREGDIISFDMGGGQVATHRIVSVEKNSGSIEFQTKGDANNTVDGKLVSSNSVIGKVEYVLPYAGYALRFLQGFWGKVAMVVVALVFIALAFVPGPRVR